MLDGISITLSTCGIARYTGATQGSAPTASRSPRARSRRNSGSVITASPIDWGAMMREQDKGCHAGIDLGIHVGARTADFWSGPNDKSCGPHRSARLLEPVHGAAIGHFASPVRATSR